MIQLIKKEGIEREISFRVRVLVAGIGGYLVNREMYGTPGSLFRFCIEGAGPSSTVSSGFGFLGFVFRRSVGVAYKC